MKYMLRCSLCGVNYEVGSTHTCDPEWEVWGVDQNPSEGQKIRGRTRRAAAAWWVMANAGDGKNHTVKVAPPDDLDNVEVITLGIRVTVSAPMRFDDQCNLIRETETEDAE
jgi:hypothetical protein